MGVEAVKGGSLTPWEPGSRAWDYRIGLVDDSLSVNPGAGGLA